MKLEVKQVPDANVKRWPEPDLLEEFSDFSGLISSIQVDAMISGCNLKVRIGDSNDIINLSGMMKQGPEGIEDLKDMALNFADGIRNSVDDMSDKYKVFYEQILKDFDENGLVMPHVGQLLGPGGKAADDQDFADAVADMHQTGISMDQ